MATLTYPTPEYCKLLMMLPHIRLILAEFFQVFITEKNPFNLNGSFSSLIVLNWRSFCSASLQETEMMEQRSMEWCGPWGTINSNWSKPDQILILSLFKVFKQKKKILNIYLPYHFEILNFHMIINNSLYYFDSYLCNRFNVLKSKSLLRSEYKFFFYWNVHFRFNKIVSFLTKCMLNLNEH